MSFRSTQSKPICWTKGTRTDSSSIYQLAQLIYPRDMLQVCTNNLTSFLSILKELISITHVLFGIIYNVIFSAIKPVGALLFGLGFWSVSKSVQNKAVRNYMIISAYGVSLLFTANQPLGLIFAPYPPFGLVTICFMGLASYLLYYGIYSASISVSEDTKLRQSIRRAALKESTKFLDSIGTAEMVQQIERKVLSMTTASKETIESESGISSSFEEEEKI